jgi:hypothetical protein
LVSHNNGRIYFEGVEDRVLGRIFGPQREEVMGSCRRLHNNGELQNLYGSQNILMGGECSTHRRDEKCIKYCGWKICREETTRKV